MQEALEAVELLLDEEETETVSRDACAEEQRRRAVENTEVLGVRDGSGEMIDGNGGLVRADL